MGLNSSRPMLLIIIAFLEMALVLGMGLIPPEIITPEYSSRATESKGFLVTFVTNIAALPFLGGFMIFLLLLFGYLLIVGSTPTVNVGG